MIAATAAVEAPMVMPMISGLANGLRSTPWNSVPATPNAAPASSATSARGSRTPSTMKSMPFCVTPVNGESSEATICSGVTG